MYEIYTPKEWTRVFGGCPSIIIDDNGYIYDKDEYYKIMGGTPMGYINYNTGKIYGKDYANFTAAPIGEIKVKEDVTEIFGEDYASFSARPILYIKNGKIYTYDDYFKIFTGGPSGYVKDPDEYWKKKEAEKERQRQEEEQRRKNESRADAAAGCLDNDFGCGIAAVVIFAIVIAAGNFIDEIKNNPAPFIISIIAAAIITFVVYKIKKGKSEGSSKTNNNVNKSSSNNNTSYSASSSNTQKSTNSPSVYTHVCTKCGVSYTSYAKNPQVKICDKCRKEAYKAKKGNNTSVKTNNYTSNSNNTNVNNTAKNTSGTSATKTPMNYAHTCPECGKSFVNTKQYPKSMLCTECEAKKKQQEKAPATKKCKVCGKEMPAYVNKSTGICMECTAKLETEKNKSKTNNNTASSTPKVYAHVCPECGSKFVNTAELPKEMLCNKCLEKKAQEKKNTEVKKPADNKKASEMTVYTCPKCSAKNKGPVGVGKIVMTCGNPNCKHKFTINT